ncbi:hypothetical protein CI109_100619 [Kwoniella shandongensis]|uniref:Uncharacterized protein n=1 Tax=Kwoniella shandongensis TaxID=1734106 RepID=A0A5M6C0T1_9TREE|nr:uncharacterized protein CI109_003459 [Kwoniella shandongensis]KAA5528170.1 hypothetical protein CI109_003459 [Kwoniella shandongensis]
MASTNRVFPMLVAGAVGVAGAYYIVAPKTELTGMSKGTTDISQEKGRSQTVKDGNKDTGNIAQSPHPALKYGGASPGNASTQSIAGTSAASRKSYSADHDVKTATPNLDGSNGGGVGVAEMRERKEKGMGGPSPQGGDSKQEKPVAATKDQGEGGGIPKQKKWWLGGW